MGKKTRRAAEAARGTAADPARAMRKQVEGQVRSSHKLVGVMPDDMAREVEGAGVYPFTFTSAFILAGAVLLGTIIIPFLLDGQGVYIGLSTTLACPLLLAAAIAFTRYFVDSRRGICFGFWLTFVIALLAATLICWLLFYKGIMIG